MPNTRRRKFSVHNDIGNRKSPKNQNEQCSYIESNVETAISSNTIKFKNTSLANSSKISTVLERFTESEAPTLISCEKHREGLDRDVSVNPTTTKLDAMDTVNNSVYQTKKSVELENRRDSTQNRRSPFRRDKRPHQHRIKVRSPKRRMLISDQDELIDVINYDNKRTIGTLPINWQYEILVFNSENITRTESTEEDERPSTHSLDDMCRICHSGDGFSLELGRLISACACRGTVGRVHVKCLERWLTESGKSRCELCGTRYSTRRVHRYGVLRALVMWILSQNTKQLMVDSLGIMLMSPLAVLAAWLSGRTLAGLMTPESRVTPWPLASTFVLACMTLVCYYCWIVSAATRHALGWWIWYRSQYEVRLQIQENDE